MSDVRSPEERAEEIVHAINQQDTFSTKINRTSIVISCSQEYSEIIDGGVFCDILHL